MDAAPPIQPQRGGVPTVLLLFLVIWILSSSEVEPVPGMSFYDTLRAARETHGNYSAWLNGTESNFTQDAVPPPVESLVRTLLPPMVPVDDPLRSSHWQNVTGFWNGSATFYNLSAPPSSLPSLWAPLAEEIAQSINQTEAREDLGAWSWDGIETTSFRINDVVALGFDEIQSVSGHLDLENAVDTVSFQFDGVHIPSTGGIYALVSPNGRQPDVRQLSAMVPETWRNATAHAVDSQLRENLKKLERQLATGLLPMDSDSGSSENTDTLCAFRFYAKLVPTSIGAALMKELEEELRKPTGASTTSAPKLQMDGLLVSRRCSVLVQLTDMTGLRADQFWHKVTSYAGFATLVYLGLLVLCVQQMEATRTPAGISSVSRLTFVFQSIMDAFSFTSHAMFGVLTKNKASMSMLAPGFLACILALMFEVRFTSLIHRIQAPEDALARNPLPPTTTTGATGGTANATAEPPPPPRTSPFARLRIILTVLSDADTRFWLVLIGFFILMIQLSGSTSSFLGTVGLLHSFWVPQIVRNVKRGTRKALSKRYVIGTSFLRLLLALYCFLCPANILFLTPTPLVYPLVGWVALQVLVLVGQEYLGATFFIPKGWIKEPDVYDYHPILPLPDPEAPEQSLGDCSICMEPILIRPEGVGSGFGAGEKDDGTSLVTASGVVGAGASLLLSRGMRRHYAFTPCSHIMHTACLEQWMRVKNICPSCRTPLPPL